SFSSSTTTEGEVLWSATGAPSSLCADKPSMIAATCASPSGARSWVLASTGVGAPLLTVTAVGRGTSGNVTGASPWSGRAGPRSRYRLLCGREQGHGTLPVPHHACPC